MHADGTDGAVAFGNDETGKAITNTNGTTTGYDSYTKLLCHFDIAKATSTTAETGQTITYVDDADCTVAQSKFGGKSLALDGTGDYVTLPHSADWDFAAGDFTIDCWGYLTADANASTICGQSDDAFAKMAFSFNVFKAGSNVSIYFSYTTDGSTIVSKSVTWSTGVITNAWYHFAVVRSGNNLYFFVDGTQVGATQDMTGVTIYNSDQVLSVGRLYGSDSYAWDGYLDELRISKGIARWTANFTVPAYPYGQVAVSTAQKEFGTASAYFDGSGSYLTLADSADWSFGTGAFTIDAWVRFNTVGNAVFVGQTDSVADDDWRFFYFSNELRFGSFDPSAIIDFRCAWTPVVDTWYHLAVVRVDSGNASTSWRLFINGVAQTITLSGGAWNASIPDLGAVLTVGAYGTTTYFHNGYIDELRISKGVARWTANFTPPTSAYAPELTWKT
jgi:hypothetical protein